MLRCGAQRVAVNPVDVHILGATVLWIVVPVGVVVVVVVVGDTVIIDKRYSSTLLLYI